MAVLQLSRLIENPACETLTIIGSKMQPFSSSAGTIRRQEWQTDSKQKHTTKQNRNIFEMIVSQSEPIFILTPWNMAN